MAHPKINILRNLIKDRFPFSGDSMIFRLKSKSNPQNFRHIDFLYNHFGFLPVGTWEHHAQSAKIGTTPKIDRHRVDADNFPSFRRVPDLRRLKEMRWNLPSR
jgi:hypothetical protein